MNNASENAHLLATFGGNHWIGINDRGGITQEGRWRWSSGQSADFRNWASGEPNDGGLFGSEDCVVMIGDGKWNDLGCGESRTALCERGN